MTGFINGRYMDSRVVFAEEAVTVAATAVGPTAATMANATGAIFQVQTAAIRMRINNTPVAGTGMLFQAGDIFEVTGNDVRDVLMIRESGTSATVFIQFYR